MPRQVQITVKKHSTKRPLMWFTNVPDSIRSPGEKKTCSFATKKEAVGHADRLRRQYAISGTKQTGMTNTQKREALKAEKILEGMGVSLSEAADYYRKRKELEGRSVTLEALFELYITRRKDQGRSQEHLHDLEYVKRKVVPLFGAELVCNLTKRQIEEGVYGLKLGSFSKNKVLSVLGSVLKAGISDEYLETNPAVLVGRLEAKRKPARILSPLQARALLEASIPLGMLPYFAIGMFAGVRRSGIRRMEWKDVDFVEGQIFVQPEGKSSGYHTPIQDVLMEWLLPYTKCEGFIVPQIDIRDRLEKVREAADKLLVKAKKKKEATLRTDWAKNVLRHTGASMLDARHKNVAQVAMWLGHDEATHRRHYFVSVIPSVANSFWAIRPGKVKNVIPMIG